MTQAFPQFAVGVISTCRNFMGENSPSHCCMPLLPETADSGCIQVLITLALIAYFAGKVYLQSNIADVLQ